MVLATHLLLSSYIVTLSETSWAWLAINSAATAPNLPEAESDLAFSVGSSSVALTVYPYSSSMLLSQGKHDGSLLSSFIGLRCRAAVLGATSSPDWSTLKKGSNCP